MTYAVTYASEGAVRPAAARQVSSRTVFAVRASAVGSATGPIRPWCCQVQFDVSVDPTAFIPRTFSVSSGFVSISPGAPRATPQEYFTALQVKGPYERLVPLSISLSFQEAFADAATISGCGLILHHVQIQQAIVHLTTAQCLASQCSGWISNTGV